MELQDHQASEQLQNEESGPLVLNAFDLIILSQGLNLSSLFDRREVSPIDLLIYGIVCCSLQYLVLN